MKRRRGRRVVVDADVCRAAGESSMQGSRAYACAVVLRTVYSVCHRVVFSQRIKEEWDRNRSRFAARWLREMLGRKKVDWEIDEPDTGLRTQVSKLEEPHRGRAMKDVHLVEAAQRTDCVVLSCDDKARAAFRRIAAAGTLPRLMWANPEREPDSVVDWFQRGAPNDPAFRLDPR